MSIAGLRKAGGFLAVFSFCVLHLFSGDLFLQTAKKHLIFFVERVTDNFFDDIYEKTKHIEVNEENLEEIEVCDEESVFPSSIKNVLFVSAANSYNAGYKNEDISAAAEEESDDEEKYGNKGKREVSKNFSEGSRKLQDLRSFASGNSTSYVVDFNITGYLYYALQKPRPYQLIMFFTVSDKKYCVECSSFENLFNKVALDYVRTDAYKRTKEKLPIVFGKMDLLKHNLIAHIHHFQTVPLVVTIESYVSITNEHLKQILITKNFRESGKLNVAIRTEDVLAPRRMPDQGLGVSNQYILDWINMKTGRNVVFQVTIFDQWSKLALVLIVLMLLFVILYSVCILIRKYPILLPLMAICIQIISTSGLFYSVQHHMQLFGYDKHTKAFQLLTKSPRTQFLGEGLIMGLVMSVCSLSLVGILNIDKTKYFSNRPLFRQFAAIVLTAIFVFAFSLVFEAHRYKTGWYNPTFFPPDDYVKGAIRNDRGNSF